MTNDVCAVARSLTKRHDTSDPFAIAKSLNIHVLYEDLGTIRGYYNTAYRSRFIHINRDLSPDEQLMVCAHELGHAVLHKNSNTCFYLNHTCFSVSKLEWEANCFMTMLLYSDDELLELSDCSLDQLESILGLPLPLIRWRFDQIKEKETLLKWDSVS